MFFYVKFEFTIFAGNSDLHNGVEYGWLYTLAETSHQPYTHVQYAEDNITLYKIQVISNTIQIGKAGVKNIQRGDV